MLAIELLFFGTRSFRCPCQPTQLKMLATGQWPKGSSAGFVAGFVMLLLLFLLLLLLLVVVMLLFFSDAVTERLLEFEGL